MSGGFAARRDEVAANVRVEIRNGVLAARKDRRAAVLARQERRVPILRAIRSEAPMVGQHDERGQIVVHAPEPVTHPRAHSRKTGKLETGGLEVSGLAMD